MMSLSVCACLSVPDHIFVHVPSSKIFLHVTYGHKEEKTCEDYRCRVGGKVEEAKWKGLGVSDHWQLVVPDQRPLNGRCCCCVVLAV